jgi:muramoyltetrapeptide carboxypeptidase
VTFLAPHALRQGDRVAVFAPAGPFDRPAFEAGLDVLRRRYTPVFTDRLFETHRYLAGTDPSRAAELQQALDDPTVHALFAARGGYGSARLLPSIRLTTPKLLVGFSDLTSLHLTAQKAGWQSLHAPVLTQLGKQSDEVIERLFALLEQRSVSALTGSRTVVPGVAVGPLLGGNLSTLTRLLGTPYLPDLSGAVLLLEDVGEKPYRLDRMWNHLVLSGVLRSIAGVVLGDFTACEDQTQAYTSAEVLDDLARALGVPCAAGFAIGHGQRNDPVMLGSHVRLDATAMTLGAA